MLASSRLPGVTDDSKSQTKSNATALCSFSTAALLACLSWNAALCQSHSGDDGDCSHINNLSGHPLSHLPRRVQTAVKTAIRPGFETIVHDKAMGMESATMDIAKLNALPITEPTASRTLYVVAWDDDSFGVNGFNWVVEVTPHGARNLTPPLAPDLRDFSSGGFGVGVLGQQTSRYPEIVIASKGFAPGRGAETEGMCLHKAGSFYQPLACPVGCGRNLNAR